jgi:integration host factor subunit alpha
MESKVAVQGTQPAPGRAFRGNCVKATLETGILHMTLTKDRLVEMLRQKTQFSSMEAKKLVEIILETMKAKLEDGEEVKISGFGKWTVKEKASRPGRNPHTGDRIEITARRVVTFHPSEKLRDAVNEANIPEEFLTKVGANGKFADDDDE